MKIKILYFIGLNLVALGVTYFTSDVVASLFLIGTLLVYFRSKDEPFWFAFFLALHDGFFGFFGAFETTLTVIPSLPAVEATQLYILLSVVKAAMAKPRYRPFFQTQLAVLGIYLAFLVVQGHVLGLSPALNVRFRVLKDILPLLAFYSIPRLFDSKRSYHEVFVYLFFVAVLAFVAQVMTIFLGQSPPMFFGISNALNVFEVDISAHNTYRGFYNPNITLITLFGAAFYLARKPREFPPVLCYLLIATNMLVAFLSASRGWTVFFFMVVALFFLFVEKASLKKVLAFAVIGSLLSGLVLSQRVIQTQVDNSIRRLQTLQAVKEGDITARGTLIRLSLRGPRVMKQWKASPLTGWGFSNHFYRYEDGHVGNQNILMHAGVCGLFLLFLFFGYFLQKLTWLSFHLLPGHPDKKALLMFLAFFAGWFFLHSAGAQQFGYSVGPSKGLAQALFFSLGAYIYYAARVARENDNSSETHANENKELSEVPGREN